MFPNLKGRALALRDRRRGPEVEVVSPVVVHKAACRRRKTGGHSAVMRVLGAGGSGGVGQIPHSGETGK